MNKISYNKGEVIFKAGEAGNTMYAIITGKVGIFINYGAEGEKCLVELTAGKYFGEMALVEAMPRSATAVAAEYTELNEISDFDAYVKDNPAIATAIIKNLSGRLRAVTTDYIDACKTISEISDEVKPKKESLWEKIKKYSKVYLDTTAYEGDMADAYYYYAMRYPLF